MSGPSSELAALLREAEQVAAALERRRPREPVPLVFTEFCAWVKVSLTAAQRVFALVAYDGLEPQDLEGTERELARTIFGPIDVIPEGARRVIVAVCGARGGKTYVIESLRLLHLSLTVPLPMLAPGEVASCPIIEPDKDLAEQALNYVRGAIQQRAELRAMVPNKVDLDPQSKLRPIELHRPDGAIVEVVCRAASAKGRTGRGRTLVAAGLGEAGFFRDADYKVNDEEIYNAVVPRIVVGGQAIVSSTPFAQLGLLFALFVANHPDPSVAGLTNRPENQGTALAAHAPTLVLRDNDPNLRQVVEAEYKRDPENAEREYGAKFMTAGTAMFFDPAALNAAIRDELVMPLVPEPGDVISAGGDTGFAKNASTLAIAHRRGSRYRTAEIYEKKAGIGETLKPSEVVNDFADIMARHGCSYFMGDGHYKATVLENLDSHHKRACEAATAARLPVPKRVSFVDAPSSPEDAFVRVNALIREGLVDLPNHPRLLRQLRETLKRPKPGGGIAIILPKWPTGEHGDIAAAWVLAVYQAFGFKVPDPPPTEGSKEWEAKQADERRKAAQKRGASQWWKR